MANVTEIAQAWHDDGDDDSHVVAKTTTEILESIIENYDLTPTMVQESALEMILSEIVELSIDWQKLADDDENAASFEDAKRSALNR